MVGRLLSVCGERETEQDSPVPEVRERERERRVATMKLLAVMTTSTLSSANCTALCGNVSNTSLVLLKSVIVFLGRSKVD